MKRKNALHRRQFLKSTLGAAGLLALAQTTGLSPQRLARAASGATRRFVLFPAYGGMDAHLAMKSLPTTHFNPEQIDQYGLIRQDALLTQRFPDTDISLFNDPKSGPQFLGPIVQESGFADCLPHLASWTMRKIHEHDDGNQMLHMGALTNYAASFPALIAQDLAYDWMRPLHYVQISENAAELHCTSGLLSSAASQPINIPVTDSNGNATLAPWITMTSANGSIERFFRRQAMRAGIEGVKDLGKGLLSAPGKSLYETFFSNFQGAQSIRGTNYGTSAEFTTIRQAYLDAIAATLAKIRLNRRFGDYFQGFTFSTYEATANAFALTEFLIKKDLSAVVVCPVTPRMGWDHHDRDPLNYLVQAVTFTCLRRFIEVMRTTQDPQSPGKSIYEALTWAFTTEFNRDYNLSVQNPTYQNDPGTNHGAATQVLMGGMNINNGRFIGDIRSGPKSLTGPAFDGIVGTFSDVPIDPSTGAPDPNGVRFGQDSFLPTVLSAFHIKVPDDQITEARPLPAIVKC